MLKEAGTGTSCEAKIKRSKSRTACGMLMVSKGGCLEERYCSGWNSGVTEGGWGSKLFVNGFSESVFYFSVDAKCAARLQRF